MKNIFPKVISFENHLEEASIIKREKRFFVEFTWEALAQKQIPEESLWAHTNNTGSMMGLVRKGRRILLSKADNPKRKLGWTLEAICIDQSLLSKSVDMGNLAEHEKSLTIKNLAEQNKSPWLGVNTSLPNKFLKELFSMRDSDGAPLLPWTEGYTNIRMEATNGESRLDACISCDSDKPSLPKKRKKGASDSLPISDSDPENPCNIKEENAKPRLWVECKSVTLVEDCVAAFPDAVSERGAKHLDTLMRIVKEGERGAMLYVVQRTDGHCFSAADYIDPHYSQKLDEAYQAGVEIYVIVANVQKDGVYFGGTLPFPK